MNLSLSRTDQRNCMSLGKHTMSLDLQLATDRFEAASRLASATPVVLSGPLPGSLGKIYPSSPSSVSGGAWGGTARNQLELMRRQRAEKNSAIDQEILDGHVDRTRRARRAARRVANYGMPGTTDTTAFRDPYYSAAQASDEDLSYLGVGRGLLPPTSYSPVGLTGISVNSSHRPKNREPGFSAVGETKWPMLPSTGEFGDMSAAACTGCHGLSP